MSAMQSHEEWTAERQARAYELAVRDAYRMLGEHGVWTMQLTRSIKGDAVKQCFASMNAVQKDTAKQVCLHWIRTKYGACDVEFKQTKGELRISAEDRQYFHAIITNIRGFDVVQEDEQ